MFLTPVLLCMLQLVAISQFDHTYFILHRVDTTHQFPFGSGKRTKKAIPRATNE